MYTKNKLGDSQNKKIRGIFFNSLEGSRGANSSDKRVEDGVNQGNVVDTTVDVEGIKELQGINGFR